MSHGLPIDHGDASPKQLTKREKSVAVSVARGLTNKQIAVEMEISVRTVENHVSHILEKTHFHNRVEIARYVMEGRINHSCGSFAVRRAPPN